jgi:hypothetical protein
VSALLDDPLPSYLAQQAAVDAAWEACERALAALPGPLAELGARFLGSISEGPAGHRAYFSRSIAPPLVYMPLWLRDGLRQRGAFPASAEAAMTPILCGAMLGYFFIRIQDDAIDDPRRADPELSLLGNACLAGSLGALRQALGAHAGFWEAFDRAFLEFSRRTLEEQRSVRGDAPYPAALFVEHADKVAFARVPLLAVAARADRLDLEAPLAALVHALGIAYGVVNDVIGWPRDLDAGHRTRLLAEAGLCGAERDRIAGTPAGPSRDAARAEVAERLRAHLYEGGLLARALGEATAAHTRAAAIAREIGMPGFDAFTEERVAWIEALRRSIQATALGRALSVASRRG